MTIHRPASNYDIACCVGKCQPIIWGCLKMQRDVSETWSMRDKNGEAFLVAGLWAREDGVAEAWFLVRNEAANHLKTLVQAIRLTLACASYDQIECRIATKEGARIARLCGFRQIETINGVEVWRYDITVRRRIKRRSQAATKNRAGKSEQADRCAGQAVG